MKRLMLGMVFQWQVLLSLLSSEWYSAYKEAIICLNYLQKLVSGLVIGLVNVNKINLSRLYSVGFLF